MSTTQTAVNVIFLKHVTGNSIGQKNFFYIGEFFVRLSLLSSRFLLLLKCTLFNFKGFGLAF